ncbi:MAG: single-stranded DNA-binding protein [Acidimicrobiia bacterium]
MDLNLAILSGHLAATPEHRSFSSGSSLLRFLVTIRSTTPRRRVDVIPVTWWDPDPEAVAGAYESGQPIWVCGSVQRRFWSTDDGRRSRIEIIAHDVQFRRDELITAENDSSAA